MSKNTNTSNTDLADQPVVGLTQIVKAFVAEVVKSSASSELLAHLQGMIDSERSTLDPFRAVRGKSWASLKSFCADPSVPTEISAKVDSGDLTLSKGDGGLRLVLPMSTVPLVLIQAPTLSGKTIATRNRVVPR